MGKRNEKVNPQRQHVSRSQTENDDVRTPEGMRD